MNVLLLLHNVFVILANKTFQLFCSFVALSVIQFVESKQTDMLTEVDRMRLGAQLTRALSEFSFFFFVSVGASEGNSSVLPRRFFRERFNLLE